MTDPAAYRDFIYRLICKLPPASSLASALDKEYSAAWDLVMEFRRGKSYD